ncbi:hypothetical protein EDB86DRAFT_256219 [Lactarius hatsudake]|nr:hypothetical protein EDB86DRAFT_256219 [Lactarius hatsudake]
MAPKPPERETDVTAISTTGLGGDPTVSEYVIGQAPVFPEDDGQTGRHGQQRLDPLCRPSRGLTIGLRVHYRRSSSSQSRVGSPRFLPSPSEANPSEPPPANVKRRGPGPAGYRIHRLTFSAQPAKDQETEGTGGARPHTAPPWRVHLRRCASNATALDTPAPDRGQWKSMYRGQFGLEGTGARAAG